MSLRLASKGFLGGATPLSIATEGYFGLEGGGVRSAKGRLVTYYEYEDDEPSVKRWKQRMIEQAIMQFFYFK